MPGLMEGGLNKEDKQSRSPHGGIVENGISSVGCGFNSLVGESHSYASAHLSPGAANH